MKFLTWLRQLVAWVRGQREKNIASLEAQERDGGPSGNNW